eukprot:2385436-Pleurochrysis_carterae.AAC.4
MSNVDGTLHVCRDSRPFARALSLGGAALLGLRHLDLVLGRLSLGRIGKDVDRREGLLLARPPRQREAVGPRRRTQQQRDGPRHHRRRPGGHQRGVGAAQPAHEREGGSAQERGCRVHRARRVKHARTLEAEKVAHNLKNVRGERARKKRCVESRVSLCWKPGRICGDTKEISRNWRTSVQATTG